MTSTFTLVTEFPVDVEAMFDVSLDIDVQAASMFNQRGSAIDGVTSGRIELDQTVTWRARFFGVWFTHTSRITELHAPRSFTDEQVAGPFRSYRHQHFFDGVPGGCRMTDHITVASPIGGRPVEAAILIPVLRRLILRRNAALAAALR